MFRGLIRTLLRERLNSISKVAACSASLESPPGRNTERGGDTAIREQAYALRTTAVPVVRRGVTETGLTIHPVQFCSMGIELC